VLITCSESQKVPWLGTVRARLGLGLGLAD
jgi:hypothetical protein